MAKILAFAGSFRKHSINKRVLKVAVEGARAAGGDVTVIDLHDYPMPVYNADDHEEHGMDPNALKFQDLLAAHDGLLIASPEYNHSIPGGLKNAIDWASRRSEKYAMGEVFKHKYGAIITAGPGAYGGVRCLGHLRLVISALGVTVIPMDASVTFAEEKFDGDRMTDQKTKHHLEKIGATLVETIGKV